ncbi:Hypothetical protein PHPALM_3350 [Phytophthora palmivora]|uniref:Uncharacterized protein n=1 Tax=Phytophthora palmivora TaxID=4796 RepID=A0A2P4YML1_9STRA|nr:Hypothetical protein PHPALM_3350 [Phytophthora palmivora]
MSLYSSHLSSINDLKAKPSAKFTIRDRTPVPTPQAKSVILQKEKTLTQEQIAAQSFDYRGLVGSLMYLVRGTRPDIGNAVWELSKYLSCYNKTHYRVAQRVLKYLKGASKYGIEYNGNSTFKLELYIDASFANAYKERKSVTGYVSLLAGCCITWKSIKQDCVSLNTAESELVAASEDVTANYYQHKVCHSSTKHIDIRHLYARDKHEEKSISITYCSTELKNLELPPMGGW